MRQDQQNGSEGKLPCSAPLATPYVPFQLENPPKYEAKKGLVRGTLFPGLDLPFMGMENKNEKNVTPMTEMQALAFAIQELALYLDTHRNDQEALQLYRSYQKMYHDCVKKYSKEFGAMNHHIVTEGSYSWLDDPWPWEYCRYKEA